MIKKYQLPLGCIKSPVKNTDYLIDSFLGIRDDGKPISFRNEMSPVENQGTLGSCVGHAYESVKEWQEYKELKKYIQLSRLWIYELSRKKAGYEEGSTMIAGAEILRELGVPLEEYWKYTDNKDKIGEPKKGAYENALIYRVDNLVYLRIRTESQLRQALLTFGPIAIGVTVYNNWYREERGHIPTSTICERARGALGGHAICLIGHNPETKEYEFKNSWSEKWGDKGYGFLTETEMKRSFMDGFALKDISNSDRRYIMKVADLSEREKRRITV